jgi:hypothetical protein
MRAALHEGLPPLPGRMKHLPLNYQGFPVPWFVAWFRDGKPCWPGVGEPDFRAVDPAKITIAVRRRRCWICGGFMGKHMSFVIGPMCAVTRSSSEPPSHHECAVFAAKACPFLIKPNMRRNEKDLPEHREMPGFAIKRNPGVACVWTTQGYTRFPATGGLLFRVGDPERVEWFAQGRPATRDEVFASIDGGLSALYEMAEKEGPDAIADLNIQHQQALALLPRED